MRLRVAWAVVAADDGRVHPGHGVHRGAPPAPERGDLGGPRVATRSAGRIGLRRDGGTHHLALSTPSTRLADARGQSALGHPGDRCLQHVGARRGRPRFRVLGSRRRLGGTAGGLAGLHGPDHHLPHRTRRSPAVGSLALGRAPCRGGSHAAHPRDADDPPQRGRGGRGLRQQGRVLAAPHGRLDARRSSTDRVGGVLGAAAAPGQGRRAAAAALDRVGRCAAGPRRGLHPGHPSHPRRRRHLARGAPAAGRAGRRARLRGRRRAAPPAGRDRPDPQSGPDVHAGDRGRGGGVRRRRRRWSAWSSTAAPEASGRRCWPPSWWRLPSSRYDTASSRSPTGLPSGPRQSRTRRWPTSAADWATARTRRRYCRPLPRPRVRPSTPSTSW